LTKHPITRDEHRAMAQHCLDTYLEAGGAGSPLAHNYDIRLLLGGILCALLGQEP
jgi:hypothetical protein